MNIEHEAFELLLDESHFPCFVWAFQIFKVVVTVHVNEVEFHIASVVFLLHKEIIQLGTRFFTDVPPDNEGLFPAGFVPCTTVKPRIESMCFTRSPRR